MILKFKNTSEQRYYRSIADVFSATVKSAGDEDRQWIVQPHVIELDGEDSPELPALAGQGIKPAVDDIVLCVTSRNNYDHDLQNRANRATGANLIIVAVFSSELTYDSIVNILRTLNVGGDFNLTGKATLGEGTQKMVLGESLAAYAGQVDAALQAIIAWGATVTPPLSGAVPSAWSGSNLSTRHKLD